MINQHLQYSKLFSARRQNKGCEISIGWHESVTSFWTWNFAIKDIFEQGIRNRRRFWCFILISIGLAFSDWQCIGCCNLRHSVCFTCAQIGRAVSNETIGIRKIMRKYRKGRFVIKQVTQSQMSNWERVAWSHHHAGHKNIGGNRLRCWLHGPDPLFRAGSVF